MVKSTVEDVLLGQTIALMKETSLTTTLKVWAFITGVIKEFTEATGRTTKWKVEAFLSGLMAESTKDSTSTIKKKDRELFTGPTVASMKVRGSMESRTALVLTQLLAGKRKWANGRTASVYSGFEYFRSLLNSKYTKKGFWGFGEIGRAHV